MSTSTEVVEVPSPTSDREPVNREIEVRRRGSLIGAVGVAGSVVALAWFVRASASGSILDWVVCALVGGVGVLHLLALVDARTPLLVADEHGLRVRRGRSWHGLAWRQVAGVEHQPRHGLLRDGSLCVIPAAQNQPVTAEDAAAAADPAVRLGLTVTTVVTGTDDLTAGLRALAGGAVEVLEVETERGAVAADDGEPAAGDAGEPADPVGPADPVESGPDVSGTAPAEAAAPWRAEAGPPEPEPAVEPRPAGPASEAPSAPPAPWATREPHRAARADVVLGSAAVRLDQDERDAAPARLPEERELRRQGHVDLVEDTVLWGDRVSAAIRSARNLEPLVVEDHAGPAVADPVIGPELAGARDRLGLSVDQLAERTRIRPHVIESIEVDDFAPCGGDFYARGHLRTLARVVGIDAAPLLRDYDAHYADAPVDARRVFEAELATGVGGAIRGTRGGPNWSVLVAAVMTVVLVWSVVQLLTDGPGDVAADVPRLNSSGGVDNGQSATQGAAVPVVLTAAGGGAEVIVRSGSQVVFDDQLAFLQTVQLDVAPPVRISSTDGGLRVSIDGVDEGALGETGQEAQDVFVP